MWDFKKHTKPRNILSKTVTLASKDQRRREFSATLHNANRIGAGFRTTKRLPIHNSVTVTLAYHDNNGTKGKETMDGKVAWVRTYNKGYILGVIWDETPTKESNPRLFDYLDFTLRA